MLKKLIILILLTFESAFPYTKVSDTLILSYTTCIGEKDHFRSNGKRLKKAADILQQDRANYHRYGIGDAKDGFDNFFSKRKNRSKMRKLLKNGYITPQLAHKIVTGNPLVRVDVYTRHIRVRDISDGSNCAEDEAFKYSGETPIGLNETFRGVFSDELEMKQATLKYLNRIGSMHNFGFARIASERGRLKMKHGIIAVYDITTSNNETRKLIATWSTTKRFNDCHGCTPALSFFELVLKKDGWHIVHSYIGALFSGNWGKAPNAKDIKLIELGTDNYAIKVKTSFATMGWGSNYVNILLPQGKMIYTVFALQTWNNNSGVGEGKKTDWETSLTFDARSKNLLADIVTIQKGWEKDKKVFNQIRYVYSPVFYRYVSNEDAKELIKEDKRAKLLKNDNLLIKDLSFPTTVNKIVDLLGRPDKVVLPDNNEPSPEGQWFIWYINGTSLKILGDDYTAERINWKAKTRGGFIESNQGAITSVYGVVVGADNYFNVRKKILQYITLNGIKNYELVSTHIFDVKQFSHFIRFRDSKTGLYVLFYFKYNKLVKVYQGTFDITMAG